MAVSLTHRFSISGHKAYVTVACKRYAVDSPNVWLATMSPGTETLHDATGTGLALVGSGLLYERLTGGGRSAQARLDPLPESGGIGRACPRRVEGPGRPGMSEAAGR